MGTNLMRALLLTSASVAMVATAAPTAAYAQEATYQIDIPAQSMGDALRALGKATKQNIVFNGSLVKGKRSASVRGRMSASDALDQMLAGSGLKMSRGSGGGLVVQAGNGAAAAANAPQRPSASQVQGRGTVTGTVKDEASGVALKGALVELVGMGRKTATNDLGEFRISNVPAGEATVRVSYLGYIGQQSSFTIGADESYAQNFTLVGGSGTQEIVVYGSRSSRAQSLNKERTNDNTSSVVSADDLGNFSGTTISEALRRVPGVAFERDGSTGDGNNIIIRGLEPNLNEVKINGIALPVGNGRGRSADLGNILADSVDSITVHKTLLPSQDSAGAGGLVEIETKSPLDRPKRYYNAQVEGARPSGDFGSDFLASGTVSAKFGASNRFGVSASVQFRDTEVRSVTFGNSLLFGSYLPLDADGFPVSSRLFIDPGRMFPFEPGADGVYASSLQSVESSTRTKTFAATISSEWQVSDSTSLRLDYQFNERDRRNLNSQISIFAFIPYQNGPVPALNGEIRAKAQWDGNLYLSQSYTAEPSVKDRTNIVTFRGSTKTPRLELDYSLGFTKGSSKSAQRGTIGFVNYGNPVVAPEFLLPEAVDAAEGRVISPFGLKSGRGIQFPLLTSAGFEYFNGSDNYYLTEAAKTLGRLSFNDRYNAELKARYNLDSNWLKYIELGSSYERSGFDSPLGDTTSYFGNLIPSDLGLQFSPSNLRKIGQSNGFDVIAGTEVLSFFRNIEDVQANSNGQLMSIDYPVDALGLGGFTREEQINAYLQTKIELGKLQLIGGVRFDRTKVTASNPRSAEVYDENDVLDLDLLNRTRQIFTESKSIDAFLPRFQLNYRADDNLILRGSYYLTIARPSIQQLSSSQSVSLALRPAYGPNFNQPQLQIIQGNPGLKPAYTHSFDISAELYDGNIGVIKLGAFYKTIKNPFDGNVQLGINSLEGIDLPDEPVFENLPGNTFVTVFRPTNGTKSNKLWGVETSFERQLTFLPGALSGLGIYANYTFTKGSRTQRLSWLETVRDGSGNIVDYISREVLIDGLPFSGQPKHSGTIAATYNKYGVDASLAYGFQSKRLLSFLGYGLSQYYGSSHTLDAKIEYRFGAAGRYRIFGEASDLLKGPKSPDLLTQQEAAGQSYVESGNYLGGRRFRAGISLSF